MSRIVIKYLILWISGRQLSPSGNATTEVQLIEIPTKEGSWKGD